MTDKCTIRLVGPSQRDYALESVSSAPDGYVVTVQEETRRLAQNNKMWAMLTDISRAEMLGRKYTPDQWKIVMMQACGWDCHFLEGLDGGFFPAGFSSSQMTVKQMADLITYMQAIGDENGVIWKGRLQYD